MESQAKYNIANEHASRQYRKALIATLQGDDPQAAKVAAQKLHKMAMHCLGPLAGLTYRPDLFQGPTGTVELFKQALRTLVKVTI